MKQRQTVEVLSGRTSAQAKDLNVCSETRQSSLHLIALMLKLGWRST